MKKYSIILFLILTVITCVIADYARDIELAQRYLALEKFDEAEEILEKLVSERPEDVRAMEMLKQVYRATKNNEALLIIIEKELAKNPKNADIWAEAGQLYLSQGQSKKATDAFNTAIKLAPENTALTLRIYSAYRAWGYVDEAIAILRTARKNAGDESLFAMEIASLHEVRGEWDFAADEYGRYLEKYPDRFREVEERMNEVSGDPSQLAALEAAVEKLRGKGIQGDRIDQLQARLQIRQNKYMEAAKSIIEAERKRGQKGMYMLAFMREALSAGKHDVVIFAGDYLKDAEPRIAEDAVIMKAKSMRATGKIETALGLLEPLKQSRIQTMAAVAFTESGNIYLHELGNLDKAEEEYLVAIQKYGRIEGTEDAYRGLTDVYLRRGDLSGAEEVLSLRRAANPQDPWALFGFGELAFFRGSTDTAAAAFRAVALAFPKSIEANNAVRYLALIVDASQSEAMMKIAQAFQFLRQRKMGEALAMLDQLIEELKAEPWADVLIWTRSTIHIETGNIESAKQDYKRIAEDYTGSFYAPLSLEQLGDLAATNGDYDNAVRHYNRILVDYSSAVNIERIREKMRDMPGNL